MRAKLIAGVITALVAAMALVGVPATPGYADEPCPYGPHDVCEPCPPPNEDKICHVVCPDFVCPREPTDIEIFTGNVLYEMRVNTTGPSGRTQEAIAQFLTAVLGALSNREQGIIGALNRSRVVEAAAAARTVVQDRNLVRDPDMSIRRAYVRDAAAAAYLAESFLRVTTDPATAKELGQTGMVAYDMYLAGTVATDETRPREAADNELLTVIAEYVDFLMRLIDKLTEADAALADAAKDKLEELEQRVRDEDDDSEEGPPGPEVLEYVALGDSYASGSGIGHYTAPGPSACHRSHLAYSGLLTGAATPSGQVLRPVNVACHGAEIPDFYQPQALIPGIEGPQQNHLSTQTTGLVTVSMGGNDLGFEEIVRACLTRSYCGVGKGNPLVSSQRLLNVQVRLGIMYHEILSRIRPDGQLVVLTYPNIAPLRFDETCLTLISQDELNMLSDFVKQLRDAIAIAAWLVENSRVRVVDMSDKFLGHSVCDDEPWANALTLPLYDSFHPNAAGHRQYAREIASALGLIGVNV